MSWQICDWLNDYGFEKRLHSIYEGIGVALRMEHRIVCIAL